MYSGKIAVRRVEVGYEKFCDKLRFYIILYK
jgi:hypothetical protein